MSESMEKKLEELEKGDIILAQYGHQVYTAVYVGRQVAKIINDWAMTGTYLDLENRFWVFHRRSFIKWLKDFLK